MAATTADAAEARRRRTVTWIVVLATLGLIFDGYDLVVYGAVVSTLLRDPSHLGPVTPAVAGLLGSYALVGVMVGALLPLAYFKMPESVAWLASQGRLEEARQLSERTGMPLPEVAPPQARAAAPAGAGKMGFAGRSAPTTCCPPWCWA